MRRLQRLRAHLVGLLQPPAPTPAYLERTRHTTVLPWHVRLFGRSPWSGAIRNVVLGLFITGIIVSLTTVFYSWKADADERSFEAGIGAIRSREYGLASAILERTVQANPSNARAFYELGTTYSVLNEGPKAIAALNESIRLDPTSDQAYIARGIQYFHDGDVPSSLKDFTQAVAIRPSMESYLQKGLALQALGLHQAAIEAFDEAIRRRTTTDNSMDMAKKASIRALKEEKRKPVRGGA